MVHVSRSIPRVAALIAATLLLGCDDAAGDAGDGSGGGVAASSGPGAPSSSSSSPSSTSAASGEVGSGGGDATGSGGSDGEGGEAPADPCPSFAAEVVDVEYGPGAGFGQEDFPDVVLGPPLGGGCCEGSLDVLSLGDGGSITLGFAATAIVDGEGPDLIVFENPFWAGGDPEAPFVELGRVEVSADGEAWHAFPCATLEAPWDACAGVTPVDANAEANDVDPLDPAVSGGDAYDLADVGIAVARFVRIVDRADQTGLAGSFDLDAVGVVHGRCDAAAR